ncbi:MAG: hypothetical protein N3D84_00835, partial [Candidatus Woesearchaeota archaeon]|nr:hypothetical protein [Candidatus Woesearchaeota archaeon]
MKKLTKSQSSVEFVVLSSIVLLFFVGLFAVISDRMLNIQETKSTNEVEDIVEIIKSEVQMASTSMDGYSRKFFLPETINGFNYTMRLLNDSTFILLYKDKRYEYFIPGNLTKDSYIYKGENLIMKTAGMVRIGSSDPCQYYKEGNMSYCIGGTCYCFFGFYDPNCTQEDDIILDHCGSSNPYLPVIDCLNIDPCNIPPKFIGGPRAYEVKDTSATIQFIANEEVTAIANYGLKESNECDFTNLDKKTKPEAGPFAANSNGFVVIKGLLPEHTYCFNITIYDRKKSFTTSNTFSFTTLPDKSPPEVVSASIIPQAGHLLT